jgi:pimeloyl-ACP methyl ester carboxylesterase
MTHRLQTQRTPLVFSHANGFPAPCYAKILGVLQNDFDIRSIARLGHDPAYPVSEGWLDLTRELIDFVEQGPHPVVAVGHSLGGFLSFMAAVKRPDLFSALILLDAPIIGGFLSRALGAAKRFGLIDHLTPGRGTRNRRAHWASETEAIKHFSTRKLFRHFDPQCLADYVHYGTVEDSDGSRVLWFDPQIEYQIYCTVPHKPYRLLPYLKVPAGFIGGRHSAEVRRIGISAMRGRFLLKRLEGSHMFPFEHPLETAQAIREMAQVLLEKQGG